MVGQGWMRRTARGAVLLVGAMLVGAMTPSAADGEWHPATCGGGGRGRVEVAQRVAIPAADGTGRRATPWFRLTARLDAAGSLAAQRLDAGVHGAKSHRTLDLPPESFAAGPFGGLVLVGDDDGAVSRLSTLDVATGCSSIVALTGDVIRRATLDPGGAAVYEVRVDRATRADLGVWRRPLDADGPTQQILPALDPDGRFGKTWSTEFAWSVDGDRLAIQTCAEFACRTRVLDPSTGQAALVDQLDLGWLIGLTRDQLITHAACRGLPCPIIATTLASGARTVLASDGGPAVVRRLAGAIRIVDTTWDGRGGRLRASTLDGRRHDDLGSLPTDTDLALDTATSGIGDLIPRGVVALIASTTRVDADGDGPIQLRVVDPGLFAPDAAGALR